MTTPIHKRVGRSRKKIAFREWQSIDNDTWHASFKQTFAELVQTEDVCVVPYINAKWTNRSRFVELCAPIEVRNEDDLVIIANLAKRLLKRETSLNDEFPGYVYRRSDWEQDMSANESSIHVVAVHRLA